MSSQVFPTLAGLGWDIERTEQWRNQKQDAFSGAQTAVAYWTYPKHNWKLMFNVLRQGTFNIPETAYTEFAQLAGFYNQLYGGYDSFLYQDQINNSVTDQTIATGDGSDTTFQLVAAFGNFVEPIFAPNVVTNVKVNGVTKTPVTDYSVSAWGTTTPGIITFTSPPANGATITSTFSFYYPCRFDNDQQTFKNFMQNMFSADGVAFTSLKLGA